MIQGAERIWVVCGGITIIISAAIILIGVAYALLKNNSISEKSVKRTEQAEMILSAEHESLAAQQQMLLDRTAAAEKIMSQIHNALLDVRSERIHYAILDDDQKRLVDSATNNGKYAQEFARVAAENQELRQKALLLERTIAKMQAQQERRPGPRRDTDWEMEL
ncbi:hypothetical protein CE91St41_24240 [Oscillospiraceae bacterium]|nr:hypothetical protein CE91St40_13300 [Oscillospiraceae bacterium]BDF75535.1 hypothetical protein CE91St41_24240 [Oscillospiraceae bacterium]